MGPEARRVDEAARHVSECLPHSLEVRHDEHDGDGGWICVSRTAAGGGSGAHGKGALLLGGDGPRGPAASTRRPWVRKNRWRAKIPSASYSSPAAVPARRWRSAVPAG